MNNNFDEQKFIRLMNEEYKVNGASDTFIAGEDAIIESNNPYFIYSCVMRIDGTSVKKMSNALINLDFEAYNPKGTGEYQLNQYIDINTSVACLKDANHEGHLKKLLEIKGLKGSDLSNLLTSCLSIATQCCPEYIPEIIKRKLDLGLFSWNSFKSCYKAIEKTSIPKEDIDRLNVLFLQKLASFEFDIQNFDLVNELIEKGYLDKEAVYYIIVNNKRAYPEARYECFKKLTLKTFAGHTHISEEDYTSLAQKLINDFKNETAFDTNFYQIQLANYVKQYNRMYNTQIITNELKSLISTMTNNNTNNVSIENNAKNINKNNTAGQGVNQ